MVNQTEIDKLQQQFEKKGSVSTTIHRGDLGYTTTRLEKLVGMTGVDSVLVSDRGLTIMLKKAKTEDIVHKIYYLASLTQANHITFVDKNHSEAVVLKKVGSFDDFADCMRRRGLRYNRVHV